MNDMTGLDDISAVVATHLPGYRVHSVARLGSGLDNDAYEVNGELIVRMAKDVDPGQVEREGRLLTTVAELSPLAVPRPVFTVPAQGCLAYFAVPGRPLLHLPRPQWMSHSARIAVVLGEFVAALQGFATEAVADLVDVDDLAPADWLSEAIEIHEVIAGHIPGEHRHRIQEFLNAPAPPPSRSLVFSHNDLGIEHVLVDPATCAVTGVIDWSDAAIVDPARDFGLICRDLGLNALEAALTAATAGDLRARAVFYARCSLIEDLAHGLETGQDAYIDKCLTALRWLFPP